MRSSLLMEYIWNSLTEEIVLLCCNLLLQPFEHVNILRKEMKYWVNQTSSTWSIHKEMLILCKTVFMKARTEQRRGWVSELGWGCWQRLCSWFICVAVWALGGALALPALFSDTAKLESDPQKMTCSKNFDVGSATSWRIATWLFLHIFGFFLPLAIMITCYSIIIVRLLRTLGFQEHKAMKVIISVVVAFLLLWTPSHIMLMVDTALRTDLIPFDCGVRRAVTMALDVTYSLALLHSCINPVLYAFVGQKFRNNMSKLLQGKVR